MSQFVRWAEATDRALYAPGGFYRRESPSHHFATSAQVPEFAAAIARLIRQVDAALGWPDRLDVVDVGAGTGELLAGLSALLPQRCRLTAVDLRPRPSWLPSRVEWRHAPPDEIDGLLIACELLDNVPCDVAVVDRRGVVRYEEVDRSGNTRLGDPIEPADAAWLGAWWPIARPGDRAEIGRPRDAKWTDLIGRLKRGTALAIDYGHIQENRPPLGTITGYSEGQQVPPVPDGSCDITVHVAVDSLTSELALPQRKALQALGVTAATPPLPEAFRNPGRYAADLSRSNAEARLLDPSGLGAHWWVLHGTGELDLARLCGVGLAESAR
jgi:SAM-dependent MidA family methyltransferase